MLKSERKPQRPVCNGVIGKRPHKRTEAEALAQYEQAINERIAQNWAWDHQEDERPGSC